MQESSLDTKTRIFNASIHLFATGGFENATTRGIANASGIKSASIYNHYNSKDEILEDCYQYFVNYKDECRLTKEQYLPILKGGTKEEVINIPNYKIPEDKHENMIYALMVTFARIHTDSRARNIYIENKNKALSYLYEFFRTGIEIGRFNPFDFQPISHVYLSVKLNAAHAVTIDPKGNEHLLENQVKMLNLLIGLIPFRQQ